MPYKHLEMSKENQKQTTGEEANENKTKILKK